MRRAQQRQQAAVARGDAGWSHVDACGRAHQSHLSGPMPRDASGSAHLASEAAAHTLAQHPARCPHAQQSAHDTPYMHMPSLAHPRLSHAAPRARPCARPVPSVAVGPGICLYLSGLSTPCRSPGPVIIRLFIARSKFRNQNIGAACLCGEPGSAKTGLLMRGTVLSWSSAAEARRSVEVHWPHFLGKDYDFKVARTEHADADAPGSLA